MPYLPAPVDSPDALADTAVVLVNLGTPDAPDTGAVRRYLSQFLSDPRIIEAPRAVWLPILHGVILRIRPRRSAHAYAQVWSPQGSPLLVHTRALAEALQATLQEAGSAPIVVRHAMRYGNPGIGPVLRELAQNGLRRLLVLPLFPQYSGTTSASVLDAVGAELRTWRRVPELRFIADYHDQDAHIEALARSVEEFRREHGRAQRLLLSFHGIPQSYVDAGDPYLRQCQTTAQRLEQRLGCAPGELMLCFQSRVGRQRWLAPYTEEVLRDLPGQGITNIQVMCPGFAVDCLETLEEIAIRNRQDYLDAGGERFDYIPALNAGPDQVSALRALVLRHTQGWPGFAPPAQRCAAGVPPPPTVPATP